MSIWKYTKIYWYQANHCTEMHKQIHDTFKGMELVIKWHCPEMPIRNKLDRPLGELHNLLASIDKAKRNKIISKYIEKNIYVFRRLQSKAIGYHHTADLFDQATKNINEICDENGINEDQASILLRSIETYTIKIKDWSNILMNLPRGVVSRYEIDADIHNIFQTFREEIESLYAYDIRPLSNDDLHSNVGKEYSKMAKW